MPHSMEYMFQTCSWPLPFLYHFKGGLFCPNGYFVAILSKRRAAAICWRRTSGAAALHIGVRSWFLQRGLLLGVRAALRCLDFYLLELGLGATSSPSSSRSGFAPTWLPTCWSSGLGYVVFYLLVIGLRPTWTSSTWTTSSATLWTTSTWCSTTWCPTTWTSSTLTSLTWSTTPWTSSSWSFACSNYVLDSRKLNWPWHPARLQHTNLQWDALRVPRVPTENQALHGEDENPEKGSWKGSQRVGSAWRHCMEVDGELRPGRCREARCDRSHLEGARQGVWVRQSRAVAPGLW